MRSKEIKETDTHKSGTALSEQTLGEGKSLATEILHSYNQKSDVSTVKNTKTNETYGTAEATGTDSGNLTSVHTGESLIPVLMTRLESLSTAIPTTESACSKPSKTATNTGIVSSAPQTEAQQLFEKENNVFRTETFQTLFDATSAYSHCLEGNGYLRYYGRPYILFSAESHYIREKHNVTCWIRWTGNETGAGTAFHFKGTRCIQSEDTMAVYEVNTLDEEKLQIKQIVQICQAALYKEYYAKTNDILIIVHMKNTAKHNDFDLAVESVPSAALEKHVLSNTEGKIRCFTYLSIYWFCTHSHICSIVLFESVFSFIHFIHRFKTGSNLEICVLVVLLCFVLLCWGKSNF